MSDLIRIDYTHRDGIPTAGKRDISTLESKAHACNLARLLDELGYPIHEVTDVIENKPIEWKSNDEKP